jgi:muconate cycloisomerase
MQIRDITCYRVPLPLRRNVKHATATRAMSESLIVACRLRDGTVGWGEGVPRSYVTGETPEAAFERLVAMPLSTWLDRDCARWSDVIALCEGMELAPAADDPRGMAGNALRCALELAILDAFGRHFGEPLSEVTRHYAPAQAIHATRFELRYSAAILSEGSTKEWLKALAIRLYGFAQCKVKIGVKGDRDETRLRTIRRWLGAHVDLRLDANGALTAANAKERLEPLLQFSISAIEQPVAHDEVTVCAALRRDLGIKVMLDESLVSVAEAKAAIAAGTCDLFNIRLSKCGGYLRSLQLAAIARQAGLGYQLGCHPGESAILSAAGRHWAASVADLSYLEGSYDRYLNGVSLSREDITFGYGGFAPALTGPGLGITVREEVVSSLATKRMTIPVNS